MTDFKAALSFISSSATAEEIVAINEAIQFRRGRLAEVARYTLKAGQAVKFAHRGIHYTGKIINVRIKKATVQVTSPVSTSYIVPLNILQVA